MTLLAFLSSIDQKMLMNDFFVVYTMLEHSKRDMFHAR